MIYAHGSGHGEVIRQGDCGRPSRGMEEFHIVEGFIICGKNIITPPFKPHGPCGRTKVRGSGYRKGPVDEQGPARADKGPPAERKSVVDVDRICAARKGPVRLDPVGGAHGNRSSVLGDSPGVTALQVDPQHTEGRVHGGVVRTIGREAGHVGCSRNAGPSADPARVRGRRPVRCRVSASPCRTHPISVRRVSHSGQSTRGRRRHERKQSQGHDSFWYTAEPTVPDC